MEKKVYVYVGEGVEYKSTVHYSIEDLEDFYKEDGYDSVEDYKLACFEEYEVGSLDWYDYLLKVAEGDESEMKDVEKAILEEAGLC